MAETNNMGNAIWVRISSLRNSVLAQLRLGSARLGQWWLREFLALFPKRIAQWLKGPGTTRLLLLQNDAFIEMSLRADTDETLDSARITSSESGLASIDEFLQRNRLARQDITIGIALPPDQFFERKLVLPLQAANSLDEIVPRDLTQKTPFRLADIHHDFAFVEDAGKLIVTQRLTKRDSVKAAAMVLGLDPAEVGFLSVHEHSGCTTFKAAITMHRGRKDQISWPHRAGLGLVTGIVLLALIAGGLKYWSQEAVLDALGPQIKIASQQAREVRDALAKLEHRHTSVSHILAEKRQGPAVLDIWEETTRLLPADSWLTELSITNALPSEGYHISMSGFSAAAAKLVLTFDQSPWFHEAALTTAVALDPIEQRERFALQAKMGVGPSRSSGP
jgi:general secretion pathway protein L